MKKNIGIVCIGLIMAFVGVSFSAAQSAYRERVLIQRHSLLGSLFSSWFSSFTAPTSMPQDAPVLTRESYNDPYSAGVTNAPAQRGPAANGISPTSRGPAGRGGSCSGDECCGSNTTFSNGACIASCSGSTGSGSVDCSTVSLNSCNATAGCRSCAQGPSGICISASDTTTQCWKCLSFASKISTPIGDVAVTSLKVGDIVWTTDAAGKRVVRPLLKASHISAPNHRVVHLILTDGRTLDVSAPHPTADGRTVGDFKVGDVYDGSIVKSAVLRPYEGSATYDILPAGDTGYYWANGILMGSTLK